MIVILNFLLCMYVWVMIYCAQRVCPIIPGNVTRDIMELRDRAACDEIIFQDDMLSAKDLPLFIQVLNVLDFVHDTIVPAFWTCTGLYILRNLS